MSEVAPMEWRERFKGVAEAQTRYLYLLGVAGVFFFALHLALPDTPTADVFGVPLSAEFVWATGPGVLGFLLAATLGSIKATSSVSLRMRLGQGEFEREDTRPNALDMAVYTTTESPRLALAFGNLTYSTYLSLFFVEGVWLWFLLLSIEDRGVPLQVALVVDAGLLLLGSARLPSFVWERFKRFWGALTEREPVPSTIVAIDMLAEVERQLRAEGGEVSTQHRDGRWTFMVNSSPIADGESPSELAVGVRTWFRKSAGNR